MFARSVSSWRCAAVGWWLAMMLVVCGLQGVRAEELSPRDAPDEAAICATARAFVEAFNRGDAEAVAAQCTDRLAAGTRPPRQMVR